MDEVEAEVAEVEVWRRGEEGKRGRGGGGKGGEERQGEWERGEGKGENQWSSG